NGRTFEIIRNTLQNELEYTIDWDVFNAQYWVPQRRERVVIVGSREPIDFSLDDIQLPEKEEGTLSSILHKTDGKEPWIEHDGNRFFDHDSGSVDPKYTLTDKLWSYLQAYADKHRSLGNGFGFGLVDHTMIARTLSARYYKDGSEILIDQGHGRNPRRLT